MLVADMITKCRVFRVDLRIVRLYEIYTYQLEILAAAAAFPRFSGFHNSG